MASFVVKHCVKIGVNHSQPSDNGSDDTWVLKAFTVFLQASFLTVHGGMMYEAARLSYAEANMKF